ncbi:putative hsp70 family chaperone lhs1 [Phaeomoniella chlamydospora]|uniref:Putative hsp70 family chaperone lhs1 n=1 Tax=Phaeomoniella chlamydospora TaxID=158046 RepID=A0A0G2E792_PHACM|nr:putative hsp70 family chaperone lhs1 [Phaeomoniella chlamydospora]
MFPCGRRRLPPFSTLLPFLILLILSTTASAASAVLGIDFGTEYIKAALVKPGVPLDIVLTKDSRRKEAATIAFKPIKSSSSDADALPERLYGADASALSARFPGDVYPNLKQLLGLSYDDEVASEYRQRFPGLAMTKVGDKVGFQSNSLGNAQDPFTLEEILAMELQNIQANAEVAVGKGLKVSDVVITIPSFYTAAERRSLELAAELAGLKVLALISDGLAVGINYATSRTFPSISDGAKPEYHLVYDMGAGSTTATVLKFQGRSIKEGRSNKPIQEVQVMGTAWDRTLGGDALNQLIVEDMVQKFVGTSKMKALDVTSTNVKKDGKTMARLWKDAEKMRQVLSANTQTSTSLEGLFYEDVNFKYKLSRTEFETLAADHASRVGVPIQKALEAAQLSLSDLESVILHGGAVRTPFAQKELELAAGGSGKIRTNVNADEAAALGAGFRAAGISPSFRVKDIRAYDASGFAVSFKWTSDRKERQQKIFTPTSQIGAEKRVPIKSVEDVTFEFFQTVDGQELPILDVRTTNLTASVGKLADQHGCSAANISTKFTVRLSPIDGLPEIVQGDVSCETEAAEKGSVIDGVKGLFGFGSKKDGQESLQEEGSIEELFEDVSAASAEASTTISSEKASATGKSSSNPQTIIIPIHFTTFPRGVSAPPAPAMLSKIQARLSSFDASDRSRRLRSEALNNLEAFTYRARDYLEDEEFKAFSSDAIRGTLQEKLSEISDWLYGEGLDASLNELKAKLKDLRTLVDPVLKRKEENAKRDIAVERLQQQIESTKNMARVVKEQLEKAAAESSFLASEASISASMTRTPETAAPFTTVGPSEPAASDDDLDDDPYFTTTSTTTIPSTAPSANAFFSAYTESDLTSLTTAYESVSSWLEEKLAAQSKLSSTDDPAVLASDLDAKAKELSDEISALLRRKIKQPPKTSSSKGKKAKTKASTKSSSTTDAESSSTATTTAANHKKDEL